MALGHMYNKIHKYSFYTGDMMFHVFFPSPLLSILEVEIKPPFPHKALPQISYNSRDSG
jgi:hypothetical protein